jgi:hypothetical protein
MLHYRATFQPLTGVEYQKQQFGPVARHLSWALAELQREGRISVTTRDYFGFIKKDYQSLTPPSLVRIKNFAPQIIDDAIDFVCARTAREISELSHNEAWRQTRIGQVIPYYTVFSLEPSYLTDDDVQDSIAEARALRPAIEAEQRAR